MVRGPRRATYHDSGQAPDTHERTERRMARKLDKVAAQTHGGYAGKSIYERLEDELTEACVAYRAISSSGPDDRTRASKWVEWAKLRGTARGKVRGLAIAISYMGIDTYRGGEGAVVKRIEREYMARARGN